MSIKRPPNPYLDRIHGFHAPCKPMDFIAATLVMILACAVLLTALDGMLADTVQPVAQAER